MSGIEFAVCHHEWQDLGRNFLLPPWAFYLLHRHIFHLHSLHQSDIVDRWGVIEMRFNLGWECHYEPSDENKVEIR